MRGGVSDKTCAIGSTRAELETLRAEQRAICVEVMTANLMPVGR